jgi:hypothetical protein
MDLISGLMGLVSGGTSTCQADRCPQKSITIPNSAMFVCECGCDKTMCKSCVIRHNLDLSRAKKHWKAAVNS